MQLIHFHSLSLLETVQLPERPMRVAATEHFAFVLSGDGQLVVVRAEPGDMHIVGVLAGGTFSNSELLAIR